MAAAAKGVCANSELCNNPNPKFLAGVLKSLKGDGGPVPMAAAATGVCANSELCKNPEFLAGVLKSLKGDGGPEPMAAAATGVCANSELCNGQMIPVTVPAGCNAGQLLSVAVPQQRAMVQQPVCSNRARRSSCSSKSGGLHRAARPPAAFGASGRSAGRSRSSSRYFWCPASAAARAIGRRCMS